MNSFLWVNWGHIVRLHIVFCSTTSLFPDANSSIDMTTFLKAWALNQNNPSPPRQVPIKNQWEQTQLLIQKADGRSKRSPHYWQSFVSFIKRAFRTLQERPLVRLWERKHKEKFHIVHLLWMGFPGWCVMIKGTFLERCSHWLSLWELVEKLNTSVQ